jgi:hypothetical protein
MNCNLRLYFPHETPKEIGKSKPPRERVPGGDFSSVFKTPEKRSKLAGRGARDARD